VSASRAPAGAAAFPYAILDQFDHRPWPMPRGPWIMTQSWHDLLFAHWPVEAPVLRRLVPDPLPLDVYDGRTWVGVIPFHMTNVAPRGVPPIPVLSAFPELNVRTYVTLQGKPGVYFFSLDATSVLTVLGARTVFHLPYYVARMTVEREAGGPQTGVRRGAGTPAGLRTGDVGYRSQRVGWGPRAAFVARYGPVGPVQPPAPGSLEHFLTERYCLYVVDRRGRPRRLEIHHPPWPLQPAEAAIAVNTMADAAGITLPRIPPLLHFAGRQDMVAWGMHAL
jgi:uncharacterized protein